MGLLDQIFAGVGGAASGATEQLNVTAELQRRREALRAQQEADINERLYRQDQLKRQEDRDDQLRLASERTAHQQAARDSSRELRDYRDSLRREERDSALDWLAREKLGVSQGQLGVAQGRLANDGARVAQGGRRVAAVEARVGQGERRVALAEKRATAKPAETDKVASGPSAADKIEAAYQRAIKRNPAGAAQAAAWRATKLKDLGRTSTSNTR